MDRQVLVVCTANLCRSPVVAALLTRQLDGLVDADGRRWTVASAGTTPHRAVIDPDTVAAAQAVGIDLGDHRSRVLAAADIERADLILTMTREHRRHVLAAAPVAGSKTFTLRELVRLAPSVRAADEVTGWVAAAAAARRGAEVTPAAAADDVSDPYRRGRAANDAMVQEVAGLTAELIRLGPWRPA